VVENTFVIIIMKWRVVLEPDPETSDWAVWCPELSGCVSAGITQEDALRNICEAIELYLQPDPIELLPDAVIREVVVGSYIQQVI
jgi:predicted RNase H-like HicB family nuclease